MKCMHVLFAVILLLALTPRYVLARHQEINTPMVCDVQSSQRVIEPLRVAGSSQVTDDNTISVKTISDDSIADGVLPQVVVTANDEQELPTSIGHFASKMDTPIIETPQSISIITKTQLEDQRPQSISKAVQYTAGAFSGLAGASSRYDYIALRGFTDSSVDNVLLDGLHMLSDQGSYSSMQVDPFFIERIDVIRGPSSVLYGRASPGGLVALVMMKPQFHAHRKIQLTLGSRNNLEGGIDITGPIDKNNVSAFRLMALGRIGHSQVDYVQEQRQAIAPSFAFNISRDTHLLLGAYLQKDPEGGYHSGIPADASINVNHNGRHISRHFFDGDPSVEKYKRTQRFLSYQL